MSSLSIPAFHVSDKSKVEGSGQVFIQSRKDLTHAGTFDIKISAKFDPATDDYPTGSVTIKADLSDSAKGTFIATSVELINSYGKHNPTIYLTGRCQEDIAAGTAAPPKGLRYWIMIADNKSQDGGTPDIACFAIHDRDGNRIAYATGPLKTGDIKVDPK